MIFLLLAPLIVGVWFSAAWSADVTPRLSAPSEVLPEHPQAPGTPPPSRIDPGIERRPQTIPDPRSAIIPRKSIPTWRSIPKRLLLPRRTRSQTIPTTYLISLRFNE